MANKKSVIDLHEASQSHRTMRLRVEAARRKAQQEEERRALREAEMLSKIVSRGTAEAVALNVVNDSASATEGAGTRTIAELLLLKYRVSGMHPVLDPRAHATRTAPLASRNAAKKIVVVWQHDPGHSVLGKRKL